jgi:hypothetical protein
MWITSLLVRLRVGRFVISCLRAVVLWHAGVALRPRGEKECHQVTKSQNGSMNFSPQR